MDKLEKINMEIILMRHGKPSFTGAPKVSSREMVDWTTQYDLSDTGSDMPPESSRVLARKAQVVISSPLLRALSSLKTLGCEPALIDEVFREADLPLHLIPGVRLSPFYWAGIFRLMWLCGMPCKVESLGMAKMRAARAAGILVNLAREYNGPVLLMGHGIMNRLIARELMLLGWKEHCRPGKGYWNAGTYQFP
ncbi:hypothetical protein SOASR030_14210 [Leminorella grimontii]|uniref:Histidine phosphatase family protein n=1 Tax=Leminorella grimontii TaxID=82981 RepID=A0AAV5N2F7_9GAMM|nr:histidine phosphatase family protein [Leminorella grimontii]GKX55309.1 hypothetical protein SOASR030_14210 [Leminorella grimontii]